jgi:hypothetical protein
VISVTVVDGDASVEVECPSGEQLRASLLENKVGRRVSRVAGNQAAGRG